MPDCGNNVSQSKLYTRKMDENPWKMFTVRLVLKKNSQKRIKCSLIYTPASQAFSALKTWKGRQFFPMVIPFGI